MDILHHELWVVQAVNAIFGPPAALLLALLGRPVAPGDQIIPDHIAMIVVITIALTIFSLIVRSRLSVENPGRFQIALEDLLSGLLAMLDNIVGPKGRRFVPLVGTLGLFIWLSNMSGLVPGLMAPTSSLNTTLGCAITVFVYYHIQGVKEQGLGPYLKHFAAPPGAPLFIAPIMLPIEIISHFSRVLSLSLRLFGNVFGEELVVLILAMIIPFLVPLPMMFLGVLTGTLQAAIFMILSMIYLGGAVASEHHEDAQAPEHAHAHGPEHQVAH